MIDPGGNNDANIKAKALAEVLERYAGTKGALIPLLQEAQEIYGYLSREVMQEIARRLKIPFSQVYGVATFYTQFHLKPRGRNIIRVCQGTACHVRGGARLLEAISATLGIGKNETTPDGRFTLETVACLGSCGLAPVMMINEETYGRLAPEKIPTILEKY
ncbi:NADH-quinone oxidoreductase subunit E [Moorella sp. E308F]|uniref:NADH-quinone oxidoreductase subunit NuoE n=1 Tax=unclassified Neomoorella TaxID=2676739 RepID=UPI0010FFB02A|nr:MULTISPECIES: NADH-quinone oxidoreductase subunit NuoE [unclassified Moorella (in: firmicutes)]GEA14246.1 NADH-quinone oxidoreductase subunit E [Moorella sp. E308F]GEA18369.1 NADH-quinone oxidoreductase subunit E [Moorella sp. E306M]